MGGVNSSWEGQKARRHKEGANFWPNRLAIAKYFLEVNRMRIENFVFGLLVIVGSLPVVALFLKTFF